MPRSVGIIANPFAGTDIRRLVAYATASNNLGKVQTLQRILVGLAEAGVREVWYMPDPCNLVPAAFHALRPSDRKTLAISPVLDRWQGTSEDTVQATGAMVRLGVGAIITLGGDGTVRLVARECSNVPLMPLAAGTNNAFPFHLEPTVVGWVTGLVAVHDNTAACRRQKVLRVTVAGAPDLALVDLALLDGSSTGTGAVWDPTPLRALVVTRALPHAVGFSAIAGRLCPVGPGDPWGVWIRFGPGRAIRAPIAPGQFATVSVLEAHRVPCGVKVEVGQGPGILAYDGERLQVIPPGARVMVEVEQEGPLVIDPALVLPT